EIEHMRALQAHIDLAAQIRGACDKRLADECLERHPGTRASGPGIARRRHPHVVDPQAIVFDGGPEMMEVVLKPAEDARRAVATQRNHSTKASTRVCLDATDGSRCRRLRSLFYHGHIAPGIDGMLRMVAAPKPGNQSM